MSQVNLVVDFITESKLFYLATNGENGPDVRPMGVAMAYEDRLYFVVAKPMNVYSQLQADAKVSISAYDGEKWLRLYGEAVLDDSAESKKGLVEMNEKLSTLFPEEVMAPYYLKNVTATIASFAGEVESCKF